MHLLVGTEEFAQRAVLTVRGHWLGICMGFEFVEKLHMCQAS